MPAMTRDLVIRYLARNAATGATLAPAPPLRTVPVPVASQYQRWCASCHGANGDGDGPNAKFLPVPPAKHTSAARMGARSDDALFDAIAGGGSVMGRSARMPAFGESIAPADIRALVLYIRAQCSCAGPAWSRDGARSRR